MDNSCKFTWLALASALEKYLNYRRKNGVAHGSSSCRQLGGGSM